MRTIQVLAGVAIAMSALAVPARAGETHMKPGTMMMIEADGKTTSMQMDDSKMSKEMMGMMDKATPMTSPMMMMMGADGKMHMANDMKMSDGKTMSDAMKMK